MEIWTNAFSTRDNKVVTHGNIHRDLDKNIKIEDLRQSRNNEAEGTYFFTLTCGTSKLKCKAVVRDEDLAIIIDEDKPDTTFGGTGKYRYLWTFPDLLFYMNEDCNWELDINHGTEHECNEHYSTAREFGLIRGAYTLKYFIGEYMLVFKWFPDLEYATSGMLKVVTLF